MRRALRCLIITSACGALLCAAARAQVARERVVRIVDYAAAARADTAHREFDVEVVRLDGRLWFWLYRRDNGAVQRFTPFAGPDSTAYATAAYTWTSDSTVVIRVRDSGGRTLASFRITGYRPPATIERLP
jgi:hypothetical protein